MPPSPPPALTDLLRHWKDGEGAAFHRVVDLAYDQLKQIAAVLGVSLSSVDRDLRFTRAWLRGELGLGG